MEEEEEEGLSGVPDGMNESCKSSQEFHVSVKIYDGNLVQMELAGCTKHVKQPPICMITVQNNESNKCIWSDFTGMRTYATL